MNEEDCDLKRLWDVEIVDSRGHARGTHGDGSATRLSADIHPRASMRNSAQPRGFYSVLLRALALFAAISAISCYTFYGHLTIKTTQILLISMEVASNAKNVLSLLKDKKEFRLLIFCRQDSRRLVMKKLKEIAKRILGVSSARHKLVTLPSKMKSTEDIFTDIYVGNKWSGKDSISGTGSDVYQTRIIISELPAVFRNFHIHTMLDIPCGDFYWMKKVNMGSVDYTGADIVMDLIQKNRQNFEKHNIHFRQLNLIKDTMPKVDLIFCRDCLVHFSFKDIFQALHNICESESTYLLTTTFTDRQHNPDIATGQWRPINLEVAPFIFPAPLTIINEECTESNGAYRDKSLGLWEIADIRAILTRRST